jgi:hypothetical protein
MRSLRPSAIVAGSILAVTVFAACAQPGVAPSLPVTGAPVAVTPQAVPPDCKGQTTTKQYATVQETLLTAGGKACIPAYGGFGGKVAYPSANPSISVVVTTSTSNYDGMPSLGKGTPIFYVQLDTSGATTFGSGVPAGGGLVGAGIVPAKTYTAFAQATVFGITQTLPPCYAVATKSVYGGRLNGLGTLLKGQQIPGKAAGVIEIYKGKQTTTKC